MRKNPSIVLVVLILFLNACTNETVSEIREVNSEAVFSTEDFEGQLQIRFFHLEPEETEKTGESIFIQTPKGKNILIDAGIPAVGPLVDEYLTQLGVDKIDMVMPSHPHIDHIGGYHTLFKTKEIGKVLQTDFDYTSEVYETYKTLIEENNINVEYVERGDLFELEEDLTLEILHPKQETIDQYLAIFDEFSAGIVNDLSMVVKLTYKDKSFLFTGDIYDAVESELVNAFGDELDVDVVVAPHHGQHTSSSAKFIEATNPDITFIPINLLYSRTVYENYLESGSEVYVSQFDGNVLLVSNGEKIDVYTEMQSEEVMEVSGD